MIGKKRKCFIRGHLYAVKNSAAICLNHKSGEIMQVDWAGDTSAVIDTDTGEVIPGYIFVATLPYSGYSYVEAFFSMNQECWTTAHANAFKHFGGRSHGAESSAVYPVEWRLVS